MENVIQTFVNEEFGAVRTLMKDGQPWFVANDVANALGYQCTYASIYRLFFLNLSKKLSLHSAE